MDEYEKSIGLLKEELSVSRKELDLIKNSLVCVRLGDLIDEISWLSGVDKNMISTSLSFNKMFPSMEDTFSYIDNINNSNGCYIIDNIKIVLFLLNHLLVVMYY